MRFYRVHAAGASIHLEPVLPCVESLDPRYVFVLDTGLKIFIWYGKKCKNTLKSKARLMAEKINKNERKNRAEIITEVMGDESKDFWITLGEENGMKPENLPEVSLTNLILDIYSIYTFFFLNILHITDGINVETIFLKVVRVYFFFK